MNRRFPRAPGSGTGAGLYFYCITFAGALSRFANSFHDFCLAAAALPQPSVSFPFFYKKAHTAQILQPERGVFR
ncbi:hypothetical protein [Fournierella sp.]|uniref:hypothetical protein n=1 Tax=Allofournierella sp. TaxID=1940256 RepID=UPI00307955B0